MALLCRDDIVAADTGIERAAVAEIGVVEFQRNARAELRTGIGKVKSLAVRRRGFFLHTLNSRVDVGHNLIPADHHNHLARTVDDAGNTV